MEKNKLKILMAASEATPIAKVGGLGDVVGSLPKALDSLGCDVRIILPLYGAINKKKYRLKKTHNNVLIPTGGKTAKINIWQSELPGTKIKIYFIDYKKYFGQINIYAFSKNAERYLFFSLACLHILPIIEFRPNIIHCHDYFTALIPDILKVAKQYGGYMKDIKTIYTIHNLNYQGQAEAEVLSTGNLSKKSLKSLTRDAQNGDINFMVQGIINADLVSTVSPTYAKEITTSVYGAGLEKVIKGNKSKVYGILNGIDMDVFNPSKDRLIKYRYSLKNLDQKIKNKLSLQKQVGLNQNREIAMVGLVSRLVWQKGLEFFTEDLIKNLDCQFVFLGAGDSRYENQLKKLARQFPGKVSVNITFDIALAQQIYAGCDIFLVPSRYEPCGLTQMIAMRYGAVPVVRDTGGLADTVDSKVGFKFKKFSEPEFRKVLGRALKVYYNKPKEWRKLQVNSMKRDFSWDKPAKEYLKLYKKLAQYSHTPHLPA